MKKWCLFLSLYFCICLLAACAGGDVSAGAGADSGGTPAEETRTGGETTEPGRVTETFRLGTAMIRLLCWPGRTAGPELCTPWTSSVWKT